jgi:hypothetical protein
VLKGHLGETWALSFVAAFPSFAVYTAIGDRKPALDFVIVSI